MHSDAAKSTSSFGRGQVRLRALKCGHRELTARYSVSIRLKTRLLLLPGQLRVQQVMKQVISKHSGIRAVGEARACDLVCADTIAPIPLVSWLVSWSKRPCELLIWALVLACHIDVIV